MKKIRLAIVLVFFTMVFIMIICRSNSFAQDTTLNTPGALFYQANINYQEGKYEAAIKNYERLIDMGWESGNLYYNLGNSYFKEEKLGQAVLSYDKARVFIPNDSDLKSNYDYVLYTLNLEPQLFGNWFEKLVYRLFEGATIGALTILLSLIYIVLILFLTLILFFSRLRRFLVLIVSVLIVLFTFSAYALNRKISYLHKFAVVVSNGVDAKFEPLENATVYFKLSEGNRVEIVDKTEGWYKVRRFDNKLAWVKKDALGN